MVMPVELTRDELLLIVGALEFQAAEDFEMDAGAQHVAAMLAARLQKIADAGDDAPPIAPDA